MKSSLDCSVVSGKDADSNEFTEGSNSSGSEAGAANSAGVALSGVQPSSLSELPSIGSSSHFSDECRACCWFPKGRCVNGFDCQYCHFDHDKSKIRKKRRHVLKSLTEKAVLNSPNQQDHFAGVQEPLNHEASSWREKLQETGRATLLYSPVVETNYSPHANLGLEPRCPGDCWDEYIYELEAQNHYLRACLMQYWWGAAMPGIGQSKGDIVLDTIREPPGIGPSKGDTIRAPPGLTLEPETASA